MPAPMRPNPFRRSWHLAEGTRISKRAWASGLGLDDARADQLIGGAKPTLFERAKLENNKERTFLVEYRDSGGDFHSFYYSKRAGESYDDMFENYDFEQVADNLDTEYAPMEEVVAIQERTPIVYDPREGKKRTAKVYDISGMAHEWKPRKKIPRPEGYF